jgi:hypothetical protein
LSSKPKHPKLVFKQSIDCLKSYLYYILVVVAAGGARAGGGWGIGGGGSSAMVVFLQAVTTAVLTNLAAVALGVLDEVERGEGVLVLAHDVYALLFL